MFMSKLETQTFQDLLAFTLSSEYCKFAREGSVQWAISCIILSYYDSLIYSDDPFLP